MGYPSLAAYAVKLVEVHLSPLKVSTLIRRKVLDRAPAESECKVCGGDSVCRAASATFLHCKEGSVMGSVLATSVSEICIHEYKQISRGMRNIFSRHRCLNLPSPKTPKPPPPPH